MGNSGEKKRTKGSNRGSGQHKRETNCGGVNGHHGPSIHHGTRPVVTREAKREEKEENQGGQSLRQ